MVKTKKRIATTLAISCLCSLFAASMLLVPLHGVRAKASTTESRNANLVVRYDMDSVEGDKLKAQKWQNGAFVADSSKDATITGTVEKVDGVEGVGSAEFGSGSYADAKLAINSDATGMTISYWAKNNTELWSDTVEFYDTAKNGARFGKGTIQGNNGNLGAWASNNAPGWEGRLDTTGGDSSFIVDSANDGMTANVWYQVTITVTANRMYMYRNGVRKIIYDKTKGPNGGGDVLAVLASIMNAAKNQSKGHVAIHGFNFDGPASDKPAGDIMDDFRIYNGEMSASEVVDLYNEYRAIQSLNSKKIHTSDPITGSVLSDINNKGCEATVSDVSAAFPKLLIGDATADDVTGSGSYTYTGATYSYSYTLTGSGASEKANVTYTENGQNVSFMVSKVSLPAFLSDIKMSINGGDYVTIAGFSPAKGNYSIALSPNVATVSFAVTEGAGTYDVNDLNNSVNLNGDNSITVTGANSATFTYTITLSRESANVVDVCAGANKTRVIKTSQTVYVNTVPESAGEIQLVPAYPASCEISEVSYTKPTLTYTATDRAVSSAQNYTITFKAQNEACFAYWDMDDVGANGTLAGQKWDTSSQKFVAASSQNLTVKVGGREVPPTEDKDASATACVTGAVGGAAQFAGWNYAYATLPMVKTDAITFSAWTKMTGIQWEAIFTLYNNSQSAGVIVEKGNMQVPAFDGGKVVKGYSNVEGATYAPNARWAEMNSSGDYVFITVTVSYRNNVGEIHFYANGNLICSYVNHSEGDNGGGNKMAQNAISAIMSGAKLGLRRHFYDLGNAACYDEVRLYSYDMSANDVKDLYNRYACMRGVEPTKSVEGVSPAYPALFGGSNSGTLASGAAYSYTAKTASAATLAEDNAPVVVTLSNNGLICTAKVSYVRALAPLTGSVTFTAGASGTVALSDPNQVLKVYSSKDDEGLDADDAVTGTVSVTPSYTGDTSASNYHGSFVYEKAHKRIVVSMWYGDYTEKVTSYSIQVRAGSNDVSIISATVGGRAITFDGTTHTATVGVEDPASYSVAVAVTLPAGASVQGVSAGANNTYTVTLTQGNNNNTFTVVSSDGTASQVYTVNAVSNNATLTALELDSGSLTPTPAFSAAVTSYVVAVPAGFEEAVTPAQIIGKVNATPVTGARVQKYYNAEQKKVILLVTAADGYTTTTYVLNLKEPSADATLSEIKVGGVAIDFNGESNITVKYMGTPGVVTAVATNANATVLVGELTEGKVTITVTPESGGVPKNYVVTFVLKSNDSSLASFKINNTAVIFTEKAGTYLAATGTRLQNLEIVASATDSNASVTYSCDEANRKITITVTAEDGSATEYTVNVTSDSNAVISTTGGVQEDNYGDLVGGCKSSLGVALIPVLVAAIGATALCLLRKRKGE